MLGRVPTPKRPTIVDVAAAAGVSKSLVSMVLRGDPGASDASREAVFAAARELGYRPNRAASILAAGSTRTIGIAVDDYRNTWYVPLFAGVREALEPVGFRVATADQTANAHLRLSALDDLVSLRVDGVIVAAEIAPGLPVPEGLPLVVAGTRAHVMPGADVVRGDEDLGAGLVVDHLVGLGHRRIGYLAGSDGTAVARRVAHERHMRAAGLTPLVVGGGGDPAAGGAPDTTEGDGYRLAATLLDAHPDVTAIVAANDPMAMGAMGAAAERDLRTPGDLSIVGYDDSPLASAALLRLTTVDARNDEVGRIAAEALLARLDGLPEEARANVSEVTVEPRLVVRSSTGSPRS